MPERCVWTVTEAEREDFIEVREKEAAALLEQKWREEEQLRLENEIGREFVQVSRAPFCCRASIQPRNGQRGMGSSVVQSSAFCESLY